MRRWSGPFLLVLLACAGLLALHSRSPRLLEDSDTQVLLARIGERNLLSWFQTDWPLENHFYRPITTLSLALDWSIWGTNAAGYAWSAAIYCVLSLLAVYWLALEVSGRKVFSAGCSLLFALWHSPVVVGWDLLLEALMVAVAIGGVVRHGASLRHYLPAVLALGFLSMELNGVYLREAPAGFYRGVMAWLPSRTATLMTVLVLCSLAAYARFERVGGLRTRPTPKPTDPPATRTSSQEVLSGPAWVWGALSLVAGVLAAGSYEQAFVLPSLLFCVAAYLNKDGYRVRWVFPAVALGLIAMVAIVRHQVLPAGYSAYQIQQLRHGENTWLSVLGYALPSLASYPFWASGFGIGPAFFSSPQFYRFPWVLAGNLVLYAAALRRNRLAVCAWTLSLLAFIPMAFLKPFPHYHYLSMALRTLLVVSLGEVAWRLSISALSPPALQAPPRLSPAPGSLPRR